jgi:XapX domain-containing protein
MKPALGVIIGFALGFGCRFFGIPSPAPPVLSGAFLVLAITLGYTGVGRLMAARAQTAGTRTGPPGGGGRAPDAPINVTAPIDIAISSKAISASLTQHRMAAEP